MDVSKLGRGEIVGVVGAVLLIIGVFVPTYSTDTRLANIDGMQGSLSVWEVHPILRWLLLAAATAPFILAYIVARGHELSWARGEMTSVVAIAALGLIVYNTLIASPGIRRATSR